MKPGTEKLILHSIFKAEVQLWPFLCMRNSRLGKQPMRRRGSFATTSRTKGNLSCTTLLIKWLSDVQRNGFVGNMCRSRTQKLSCGKLIMLNYVIVNNTVCYEIYC